MQSPRSSKRFVVVVQSSVGMVVQSSHKTLAAAMKERDRMHKKSEVAIYGAFALVNHLGISNQDYKPGDLVLAKNLVWQKTADGCSECCDNCQPDSLKYRCPILRGSPICAAVEVSRAAPAMTEEDHKAEIRQLKISQLRVTISRLKQQLGEAVDRLQRLENPDSFYLEERTTNDQA